MIYAKNEEERSSMNKIPYASVVESLVLAMIYTRPDLAHSVSVVSRYMSNLGLEH